MVRTANAVVSSARDIRCDRVVLTSSAEVQPVITTICFSDRERERERERETALESSSAAMGLTQRRGAARHLPSPQSDCDREPRENPERTEN